MMRVLVADDEAPARGKLQRWLSEQGDIEVVAESEDGLSAAEAIERLRPDVVFLDIQMPGLSGLEVAAQLEQETAPLIVFVTAFDEHAIKAFELNAIDYLLKPYDKDRLLKTLSRIRARPADGSPRAAVATARAQTQSRERLLVPVGETLQLIDSATIEWLEADDNYVHVHTSCAQLHPAPHVAGPARTARRAAVRSHPQIGGGEYRGGEGVHAAVQGRLRSAAAERQDAAAEPSLQGRAIRPDGAVRETVSRQDAKTPGRIRASKLSNSELLSFSLSSLAILASWRDIPGPVPLTPRSPPSPHSCGPQSRAGPSSSRT